ncbi:MAG: hypothetical protein IKU26_05055 [Clostridia bacterium]|nr:hypothetical protein [Clostridia bacterium]
MRRRCVHSLTLFMAILLLLSVGGVCATWTYTYQDCQDVQGNYMGIQLALFDYPPEEILPGGEMEEAELGGDHFALVDLVLNENEKGYGLNINNNVVLHQYLKRQKVVYSNQKVSGGNLKFILDPQNNTHGLYYCVEKVSDTEYYCYTFSEDALATASGSSNEIVAYRTTLTKTDRWRATTSYMGYAKVRSLSALGESADPQAIPYSIDINTWHV